MTGLARFVREGLGACADPAKAAPMARYMKTSMPFYGVQKPERESMYKEMRRRFVPSTREEYELGILSLWKLPHREEKYAAIEYARQHPAFIRMDSLPLYERMIREGAWWDFVDDIAANLVGRAAQDDWKRMKPVLDRWIQDPDLWIRRSAILAQLRFKEKTDSETLFRYCRLRSAEHEFFIRKAIGWSLRQYARVAPDAVRGFLRENRSRLSPLSLREAGKHL